jgi:hypothetical protein
MELMLEAQTDDERDQEDAAIWRWQAEQLNQLGLSWPLAFTFAPLVDWHEVAELVDSGCSPELAVEIAR